MAGKRIVITLFGSLGDLHPYLALGIALQTRGHRVTIAANHFYRDKVESEGLAFHSVRPDISPDDHEAVRRAMDTRTGGEYVLRTMVLPHLRDTYADLAQAIRGADMLISHPITFAAPVLAQKTGIRWVSSVLAPLSFLSSCDPPVLAPVPWLTRFAAFNRVFGRLARRAVRSWSEPVRELRAELGLPPGGDPIFEGQHSPDLVLALFSPLLGAPQPDWPRNSHATGFLFYDRLEKHQGLPAELARFLDSGPPPIVFTLGSSAVVSAGNFFTESAKAAAAIGRRAVLLIGRDPANLPRDPLPDGIIAADYAPYSEILPRAAAVVHQGGAGTTAQALRAGRPMLFVPFAHDQHDNAARCVRLGVAGQVRRHGYRAPRVAAELRKLLQDPARAARASDIGRRIQAEDGAAAACDLIERQFSAARPASA